ncbi:hypothetical protein [Paenibacillus sp. NAIST15-1]|uniref:hypothetical protein n=1 Tax=Paenibacillus sp. NAIST15-1 TaxID=1605994 RepID=UPI0008688A4C|nr:hypothetical protein [Paenibacillus sp. NAIST15-1]GAV16093.1 structural protein [Paenibacillus sp. NAIST15-1]
MTKQDEIIEKVMLFVDENKGEKDGRSYHTIKLGDPLACESAVFWLNERSNINTSVFKKGDRVKTFLKLNIYNGRMMVSLMDLKAV